MHADTELHPPVFGEGGVANPKHTLGLDRAAHCVRRRRELSEDVVTGRINDPPSVLSDEAVISSR
jgi:hypothetical protein